MAELSHEMAHAIIGSPFIKFAFKWAEVEYPKEMGHAEEYAADHFLAVSKKDHLRNLDSSLPACRECESHPGYIERSKNIDCILRLLSKEEKLNQRIFNNNQLSSLD